MHILRSISLLTVLFVAPGAFAALDLPPKVKVSGVVQDAATGDTLAAANVRALGTSLGTITNIQGRFVLMLEPSSWRLVISSLGYAPDTLSLTIAADTALVVLLKPSDIVLPEIVVTSEDPALEIIRRAIANKRKWISRLRSYEMDAFTRQTVQRDTAIASITESYTKGYWQRGDTLRETILQRRQTANIEERFNFASVGRILNFMEDRIRFAGFDFVGPTANDALDFYDYKLLRTRRDEGRDVFEIRTIPRTRTTPLFAGTVNIIDGSYALVGVEVEPNEAFQIPLVRDKRIQYCQQFSLYDDLFWMPVDIRIDASFAISLVGFSLPRIGFSQTSVIYNYAINTMIPDSILQRPRLVVDSASTKYDSTFWANTSVLALSPREQEAYTTLDSTQTLDVQFRPGGLAARIGGDGGVIGSVLEYIDLSFNRVEGVHAGLKFEVDDVLPVLALRGGAAYGFSSKLLTYRLGTTLFATAKRTLGVGGDVVRVIDVVPDQGYFGPFVNSFTCLFARNDYRDYYRSEGWSVFGVVQPSSVVKGQLSFTSADHRSAAQTTDFSFFARSRLYRENPPVNEGRLRSLGFTVRIGEDAVPLELVLRDAVEVSVEYSSPSIASSDFRFTRATAVGTVTLPTFGDAFFLQPSLRLRVAAGMSSGDLPAQRLFTLESSSSGLGPFGVLRAASVREFQGTEYMALSVEHTFRSLPFLALGIPFLYENGIELLVHGAVARSWDRSARALHTTDGWYGEVGFGIGRILEVLRVDATWRLDGVNRFVVTVATTALL